MKSSKPNKLVMSVKKAIIFHKLDRRYSYTSYGDELVYNINVTGICTGCEGHGCSECGWCGKRVNHCPCPVVDSNGHIIKVKPIDKFISLRNFKNE